MYICLECGSTFSTPTHYREYRGECFGYPAHEEFMACPCCGGAFAETYECDCCGKLITGEYIETKDGFRYCDECYCFKYIGEDD